ncbi:MAG: hypothetical protein AB7P99_11320 [Vicinamibacterales bacterium]
MARHAYAYVLVYLCALCAALAATGCSEANPLRPTQVSVAAQSPAPPGLHAVTLGASAVIAGDPLTGVVALTSPAVDGGVVVQLAATNPQTTLPAAVTIAAGSATAAFALTAPLVDDESVLTITATQGGHTVSAQLTVVPLPVLDVLDLSSKDQVGSDPVTGWVMLRRPAPAGGVFVTLGTSSRIASTPQGVTVRAGERIGTFTVRTTVVPQPSEVHVKATLRDRTLLVRLLLVPLGEGEEAGSGGTTGAETGEGAASGTTGGGTTGGTTDGGDTGGDDTDDGGPGTCGLSLKGGAIPPGGGGGGCGGAV